jgi:hypothetical protein
LVPLRAKHAPPTADKEPTLIEVTSHHDYRRPKEEQHTVHL